jgi:SNF2 family DNA or RNA helicase
MPVATRATAAIQISGKELLVTPPKYPSSEVKEVLGGRWDKSRKAWRLPPTSLNMITLVEWYGKGILDGAHPAIKHLALADWGYTGFGASNQALWQRAKEHPHWEDLYDFQQEGVEYMVTNPHRGTLLALSPGLGKSPTSIVAADILEAKRILVVAPVTLAKQWMTEWDKWSSMYRSWSRATAANKDPRTECVVTNYETLFESVFMDEDGEIWEYPPLVDDNGDIVGEIRGPGPQKKWVQNGPKVEDKRTGKMVPARKRIVQCRESYSKINWDLLIVDESILLKNRKAVKADVLEELAVYCQQVWLLSGSPTSKFRTDLYPQVKAIMPRGFRSYWRFADFFCVVDREGWGWSIEGDRPDHDPKKYLKDFMFVRNQKDVLEELPDYIYEPIDIELNADQLKAFTALAEDFETTLDTGKKITAEIKLAQYTRMIQTTSNLVNLDRHLRSSAKEDLLHTLIQQDDIEYPLLVWTWWVPTTQSIYDRLYDHTDLVVDMVVGSMASDEKDEVLTDYKSGNLDVLILQMGVGKFGHNLQDTRTVFYHDRHFDSDAYLQTLRRVRRIGLEHRPRLIVPRADYSADPLVEMNLAGKLQSIARTSNHDLKELMKSLGSRMIPWSIDRDPWVPE